MPAINPYLHFDNNAEEAFNFYKSVFGGEFAMVMRFKDVPPEHKMPEEEGNLIMHIAFPIGKGNILMGSDTPSAYGKTLVGGHISISITTDSEEESDRIFNGLAAGGQVTMPLSKAFWGSYFGMLKDKFGVQWMVSYDYNSPQ